MPKKEVPPVQYYAPVLEGYRSVNNAAARRIYFTETEPSGGRPTHGRALHVRKAENVMQAFLNDVCRDILSNAVMTWKKGLPIPHPDEVFPGTGIPLQPLAEGVTPSYPDHLRLTD